MKQQTAYTVAVVGATGLVGQSLIEVLEERAFPVKRLVPLASERSLGRVVEFQGEEIAVEVLDTESFAGVDIALFSAGGDVSREFGPIAAAAGALVIDNSSAFRMDPEVPLVVPEVNAQDCMQWRKKGIIANPNCSTIQMCVALKPLHDAATLRRVIVSTYQATSGAGLAAMEELTNQVRAVFSGEDPECKAFAQPIAFNCLPQIDDFLENGYTKEEWKMVTETRKILGLPDLAVTATAVRVPVFVGHSEAVHMEFAQPLSASAAQGVLREAPGVIVFDDPAELRYPVARDVAGSDAVHVGRIREDVGLPNGLACWIVADNVRKGAALNAVQIAEVVLNQVAAN